MVGSYYRLLWSTAWLSHCNVVLYVACTEHVEWTPVEGEDPEGQGKLPTCASVMEQIFISTRLK